jgi:PIN domain nuclease of toxin-antitoxin system
MDTHALLFWQSKQSVSQQFIQYLDEQAEKGRLFVSSIAFWEIALLVQKGRIAPMNIHAWKNELLQNSNIQLINPSASDMIDSTLLPPHHKDPFDRLLIAQANNNNLKLVTKDQAISNYQVALFWI